MKQKVFVAFVLLLIISVMGQDFVVAAEASSSKRKGYLGISIKRLTTRDKRELEVDQGVLVTWVKEDSPADEAGIMEDDVIIKIDGKKIRRPTTVSRIISRTEPGTRINVVVVRDGQQENIKVKVGKKRRHYSGVFNFFGDPFDWSGSRPYLGVELLELNDDLAAYFDVKADDGVLIVEITEDSPAEKAGLKAGDVILKLENEQVSDPEDVKEIVAEYEDGDEVTIEVKRHKRNRTFKVMLEENKCAGYNFQFHTLPKLKHLEKEIPEKLEKLDRYYYRYEDNLKKAKRKLQGLNTI